MLGSYAVHCIPDTHKDQVQFNATVYVDQIMSLKELSWRLIGNRCEKCGPSLEQMEYKAKEHDDRAAKKGEEPREGLRQSPRNAGGQASRWSGVGVCTSVTLPLVHESTCPYAARWNSPRGRRMLWRSSLPLWLTPCGNSVVHDLKTPGENKNDSKVKLTWDSIEDRRSANEQHRKRLTEEAHTFADVRT